MHACSGGRGARESCPERQHTPQFGAGGPCLSVDRVAQLLVHADRERVRIHPKDARRLGIDTGETVDVVSRRGVVSVEAEITRSTKPGTVFMTFHFPETRTNLLLSSAADPETGCPEYKVSAVRVEKRV